MIIVKGGGAEKSIHFSPLAEGDQPVSVVPLIVSSLIERNPFKKPLFCPAAKTTTKKKTPKMAAKTWWGFFFLFPFKK